MTIILDQHYIIEMEIAARKLLEVRTICGEHEHKANPSSGAWAADVHKYTAQYNLALFELENAAMDWIRSLEKGQV